jgi:hypothetical protein
MPKAIGMTINSYTTGFPVRRAMTAPMTAHHDSTVPNPALVNARSRPVTSGSRRS